MAYVFRSRESPLLRLLRARSAFLVFGIVNETGESKMSADEIVSSKSADNGDNCVRERVQNIVDQYDAKFIIPLMCELRHVNSKNPEGQAQSIYPNREKDDFATGLFCISNQEISDSKHDELMRTKLSMFRTRKSDIPIDANTEQALGCGRGTKRYFQMLQRFYGLLLVFLQGKLSVSVFFQRLEY